MTAKDHAAEAEDFLNIAYGNASDPHEVRCGHVSAIVNSNLAIAEQLRLANLLSFAAMRVQWGDGSSLFTSRDMASKLHFAVGEALGLDKEAR